MVFLVKISVLASNLLQGQRLGSVPCWRAAFTITGQTILTYGSAP